MGKSEYRISKSETMFENCAAEPRNEHGLTYAIPYIPDLTIKGLFKSETFVSYFFLDRRILFWEQRNDDPFRLSLPLNECDQGTSAAPLFFLVSSSLLPIQLALTNCALSPFEYVTVKEPPLRSNVYI